MLDLQSRDNGDGDMHKGRLWSVTAVMLLAIPARYMHAQNEPPGAAAAAQTLVGTTFYACRSAGLRPVDGKPMPAIIQPVDPLTVISVQVSNPTKFPGARVLMTLRPQIDLGKELRTIGPDVTIMAFVEPADLTPGNIRIGVTKDIPLRLHIPNGGSYVPEKGMSLSDVNCIMSTPEEKNDYGDGEEQLIYDHGSLIIYVDQETDRVVNIQTFQNYRDE